MNKNNYGFFEFIGSVIMLMIDPSRNNKKYINPKYYKLDKIVGILSFIIFVILISISLCKISYICFSKK